jgi:hypothetical protein
MELCHTIHEKWLKTATPLICHFRYGVVFSSTYKNQDGNGPFDIIVIALL